MKELSNADYELAVRLLRSYAYGGGGGSQTLAEQNARRRARQLIRKLERKDGKEWKEKNR